MKKLSSILLVTVLVLLTFNSAFAAENSDREHNIKQIKTYIEESNRAIASALNDLSDNANLTLEDVQKVIEMYYKENPAPEAFNDTSLSIMDVYPEAAKQIKEVQNEALNLNDLIRDKKSEGEQVITLEHSLGEINVYLADTGGIVILERRVVETNNSDSSTLSSWRYTDKERTTGIAYNADGFAMFSVWAEGQFQYNGSDVGHANSDGDWNRYLAGSTLNIEERKLGETRFEYLQDGNTQYKYAEVYSRLYYEAGFGIRWAQITLSSGTVEVYVGSTVSGNIYGGATRVN